MLTLGFFLGILDSSIQDFCLLAVMGLLTDFYLQTFFFLTVLSMDINRTKMVDLVQKQNHLRTFRNPMSGPGMKISTPGEQGEWLVAPPITPPSRNKPSKVCICYVYILCENLSNLFGSDRSLRCQDVCVSVCVSV